VSVGNDRLLKASFGGKVKVPLPDQLKLNEFVRSKVGTLLVYVVIEDKLEMVLSLSGQFFPSSYLYPCFSSP
jgi:hypothetical protein